MATLTAVKPPNTNLWTYIFPNEQVTEQQSTLFVKKLLAVAVSNIMYLRAMFPEQAFGDRCLDELNLKILREDTSCPGACQVIKWMKACFDAVDKKYLQQLIIGLQSVTIHFFPIHTTIYTDPDDLNSIIESYTFKFSYLQTGIDIYRNNSKVSSACNTTDTKKATLQLLRTIIVLTQTLRPLPDDALMTIKLFYHDEITPTDYEPPGFKQANPKSFHFDEEPMNIKIGNIPTPFHLVKLRIKTKKSQFDEKEDLTIVDGDDSDITKSGKPINNEDNPHVGEHKAAAAVPVVTDPDMPTEASIRLPEDAEKTGNTDIQRCPCGSNDEDGLMILCAICKYWQHAVCFQILSGDKAPTVHICESCAEPGTEGKNPTDPSLSGLSQMSLQATCLWRRALLLCMEESQFTLLGFTKKLGLENTVAHGLYHRLEQEGIIRKAVKGRSRRSGIVDMKILKVCISKYFKIDGDQRIKENKDTKINLNSQSTTGGNSLSQVDGITQQAKDMSLSEKKVLNSQTRRMLKNGPSPSNTMRSQTTRRKRSLVVASSNEKLELCNSQETYDPASKRKKASLAVKSIVV